MARLMTFAEAQAAYGKAVSALDEHQGKTYRAYVWQTE